MKIEELMIGDWVCLEDENLPLEERYFKIEYLAISAGVSWVNQGTNAPIGLWDGESLIPVFTDEIYPIPLTLEILKKNGFKYEKKNVVFPNRSWDEVAIEYMYCEGLRCSFDIIHGYLIFNSNTDLKEIRMIVTYVHELQHALKLCGIDKEIGVC